MKIFSEYLGKPKYLLTILALLHILCVAIMPLRKSIVMKQIQGNQRQAILLSYIAGIIDGEGCLRIGKCSGKKTMESTRSINTKYAAYIQVGMVERVIPELLKSQFGGSVREECVPDRRSVWRWVLSSRLQVTKVAKTLLPYLIIKKKHAKNMIDFCDNWVRTGRWVDHKIVKQELQRREEAYQRMRKFNAVGAAATTKRENIREDEAIV